LTLLVEEPFDESPYDARHREAVLVRPSPEPLVELRREPHGEHRDARPGGLDRSDLSRRRGVGEQQHLRRKRRRARSRVRKRDRRRSSGWRHRRRQRRTDERREDLILLSLRKPSHRLEQQLGNAVVQPDLLGPWEPISRYRRGDIVRQPTFTCKWPEARRGDV